MDLTAFSHGQVQSKLWLCSVLEAFLPNEKLNVAILGCWYNVMGFMLATKLRHKFRRIDGFDIDVAAIETADKICSGWIVQENYITNRVADVNLINLNFYDLVINCSPEHMTESTWFDNIKKDSIVCVQSSDIQDSKEPWLVTNPVKNLNEFTNKYPLRSYFVGEKEFDYGNFAYNRFMIVGRK